MTTGTSDHKQYYSMMESLASYNRYPEHSAVKSGTEWWKASLGKKLDIKAPPTFWHDCNYSWLPICVWPAYLQRQIVVYV